MSEPEVDASPYDLAPQGGDGRAGALCLHGLTGTPYEITLNKRYQRKDTFRIARWPMDWVHHRLLLNENELRWQQPTPVLLFALSAFCFETMQYREAHRHLESRSALGKTVLVTG